MASGESKRHLYVIRGIPKPDVHDECKSGRGFIRRSAEAGHLQSCNCEPFKQRQVWAHTDHI